MNVMKDNNAVYPMIFYGRATPVKNHSEYSYMNEITIISEGTRKKKQVY